MSTEAARNTLTTMSVDPNVPADVKDQLKTVISQLPAYLGDRWIYRAVVAVLGLVVLMTVGGGIYLAVSATGTTPVQIPDAIVAIGSAALGALAGLLAPSPNA
jgi:hypothetical protein